MHRPSVLLVLLLAAVAVQAAAPHGLVPSASPSSASAASASASAPASTPDLLERPMSEDAQFVQKIPIHDTTAASPPAAALASPAVKSATHASSPSHVLSDWLHKRELKPKTHRWGKHYGHGERKHPRKHKFVGHEKLKRVEKQEPAKVPVDASSKPAVASASAAESKHQSYRSALDRLVKRARRIFKSAKVQQAIEETKKDVRKMEQEITDKSAAAIQQQKDMEAACAAKAKAKAAAQKPSQPTVATSSSISRPMHILLSGELNQSHTPPPIATALSLTDIIIIVVVVCVVLFCCGGFGYHRYSRRTTL